MHPVGSYRTDTLNSLRGRQTKLNQNRKLKKKKDLRAFTVHTVGDTNYFGSGANSQTTPFYIPAPKGTSSLCNFLRIQFHTFLTGRNATYGIFTPYSTALHWTNNQRLVRWWMTLRSSGLRECVVWYPCGVVSNPPSSANVGGGSGNDL